MPLSHINTHKHTNRERGDNMRDKMQDNLKEIEFNLREVSEATSTRGQECDLPLIHCRFQKEIEVFHNADKLS